MSYFTPLTDSKRPLILDHYEDQDLVKSQFDQTNRIYKEGNREIYATQDRYYFVKDQSVAGIIDFVPVEHHGQLYAQLDFVYIPLIHRSAKSIVNLLETFNCAVNMPLLIDGVTYHPFEKIIDLINTRSLRKLSLLNKLSGQFEEYRNIGDIDLAIVLMPVDRDSDADHLEVAQYEKTRIGKCQYVTNIDPYIEIFQTADEIIFVRNASECIGFANIKENDQTIDIVSLHIPVIFQNYATLIWILFATAVVKQKELMLDCPQHNIQDYQLLRPRELTLFKLQRYHENQWSSISMLTSLDQKVRLRTSYRDFAIRASKKWPTTVYHRLDSIIGDFAWF